MSKLISKEQAMAYPLSYDHYDKVHGSIKFINGVESYRDYIDGLPTVEERKHGHWIAYCGGLHKCSVCKYEYTDRIECTNYCGNCGAIMDEASEDERTRH